MPVETLKVSPVKILEMPLSDGGGGEVSNLTSMTSINVYFSCEEKPRILQ